MELGVALPTAGPQTTPETIVRVAEEAERLAWLGLLGETIEAADRIGVHAP